jgi:hypothetical protein
VEPYYVLSCGSDRPVSQSSLDAALQRVREALTRHDVADVRAVRASQAASRIEVRVAARGERRDVVSTVWRALLVMIDALPGWDRFAVTNGRRDMGDEPVGPDDITYGDGCVLRALYERDRGHDGLSVYFLSSPSDANGTDVRERLERLAGRGLVLQNPERQHQWILTAEGWSAIGRPLDRGRPASVTHANGSGRNRPVAFHEQASAVTD